jgi:DNA-binding NarL/FixJ family response regulator
MDMKNKAVRILIADDHPLFLRGLREIIDSEADWQVIAEAKDGKEAMKLIQEEEPDIVVLDIEMPRMDGLEVVRQICEKHISTDVIMLTMYDDPLLFNRAASFGIKGFILKESAVDDIIEGISHVVQGETFISPKLTMHIFHENTDRHTLKDLFRYRLTKMEQKIIRLIAESHTTRSIADMLFISPKTVEHHRSNICKKLNLSGKNALLHYVLENKDTLQKILIDY